MTAPLPSGPRFGSFILDGIIAASRAGAVFAARRPGDSQRYTVGVLDPALTAVPGLVQAFLESADAASRRDHPALVRVFEAGMEQQLAYVVSEALDGFDGAVLVRRCRTGAALPLRHAVSLAAEAAEAVAALHAVGSADAAQHLRLAPDKLFLTRAGHFKLIGIGLPLVGQEAWPLPEDLEHYAMLAPEQVSGGGAGQAADIYSLALLATVLVTGCNPFLRPTLPQTTDAIVAGDQRCRGETRRLPPELALVLGNGLALEPSARTGAAAWLADALEDLLPQYGGRVSAEEWATCLRERFPSEPSLDGVKEAALRERAARLLAVVGSRSSGPITPLPRRLSEPESPVAPPVRSPEAESPPAPPVRRVEAPPPAPVAAVPNFVRVEAPVAPPIRVEAPVAPPIRVEAPPPVRLAAAPVPPPLVLPAPSFTAAPKAAVAPPRRGLAGLLVGGAGVGLIGLALGIWLLARPSAPEETVTAAVGVPAPPVAAEAVLVEAALAGPVDPVPAGEASPASPPELPADAAAGLAEDPAALARRAAEEQAAEAARRAEAEREALTARLAEAEKKAAELASAAAAPRVVEAGLAAEPAPAASTRTPAPAAAAPVAGTPAPVAESFLDNLSVDVGSGGVVVAASLSGKAVRPFHYLDQEAGASGASRYVVRLKGVKSRAGVTRLPVAAPGVRGVTLREDASGVVLVVDCDCSEGAPVRLSSGAAGFELSIPTHR